MVWFAPPCNSWIVTSQSTTAGTPEHPEGMHPDCREYNEMVDFLALAISACTALGLFWVVEDTLASWLFQYRALARAFLELQAQRCFVALGKAGHHTCKPLTLMGTAPWLRSLEAAVAAGESSATATLSHRVHNGWTGNHDAMDSSRECPLEFCIFVAKLHMKHMSNPSDGERPPKKVRASWAKELARRELAG